MASLSLYANPTASVLRSTIVNSGPAIASQLARSFSTITRNLTTTDFTRSPLCCRRSILRTSARARPHLQLLRPPLPRLLSTTASGLTPAAIKDSQVGPIPKWKPPAEECLDERPVLIIGAGNLGRRIALVWASASRPVTIYDSSTDALIEATEYITDNLGAYCTSRGTHPGHVCTTTDPRVATTTGRFEGAKIDDVVQDIELHSGSKGPWMAIDCLPESLELKISMLSQFEHLLPGDAILASNSASLMTSEMAPHLHHPERLLNTHYFIPPRNRMVELMSSSRTYDEIFPFLTRQMKRVGLTPMVVPPGIQSQGLIFNRIWAACKQETLAVLAEGVARPADVDALFKDFFHAEKGPCERMDEIGLDTIAKVQKHYYDEQEQRGQEPIGLHPNESGAAANRRPLDWLLRNYVDQGKLGDKSGGDGLFTHREREKLRMGHEEKKHHVVEETTGA